MKRTTFIAIVGRPNVGKSTLLNAILGEKIAIVSSKPQTTRNRITGIYTKDEDQIVFVDTPGFQKPRTKLGEYMLAASDSSIGSSDAVILIADVNYGLGEIEKNIIEKIKKTKLPSILVLNKTDMATPEKVAEAIMEYDSYYKFDAVVPTSASRGNGVDAVIEECSKYLCESEWFFPDDIVTDQPEKKIASEIIREKLLRLLEDEIPHGTAVTIEEWSEKRDMVKIRAEIYCERQTHKGIIIGKHGATIKQIGVYARQDIERMLDTKVFLDLYVRVKENWRDSDFNINDFGYNENKDY